MNEQLPESRMTDAEADFETLDEMRRDPGPWSRALGLLSNLYERGDNNEV